MKRKKTRRGQKTQNSMTKFKVLFNNLRGIKSKLVSVKEIIEKQSPVIVGLAETKMNDGEKIKIEGYKIERVDRKEDGGGVMIELINFIPCFKFYFTVIVPLIPTQPG